MNTVQENIAALQSEEVWLAELIKRWGTPVSALLISLPYRLFRVPNLEGAIGYQLVGNCAVVIGDPLCAPNETALLAEEFHLHAQKCNWSIVYLLASKSFTHWALQNGCQSAIHVVDSLVIDPQNFQIKEKLRWKIRQSMQKEVLIAEYQHDDPSLEQQIQDAIETWLQHKHGPQIFLGEINPFSKYPRRRIFYALKNNKIVGFLQMLNIQLYGGWTVSTFLATPQAPAGVSEHLISTVIETLAQENCRFLCLGFAVGHKLGEIAGMRLLAKWMAQFIFQLAKWLFRLDARSVYYKKFNPQKVPAFLLFSNKMSFQELLALKQVLKVQL
jgi:lysylphosphatidylglycerol synthetase-like protein (DUF2156 family)